MENRRSAAVTASRAAKGLKARSLYLDDVQRARWKALATARGETLTATVIAGLDALEARSDHPSPEEALRVLSALVKDNRRRRAAQKTEGAQL